MSYRKPKRPSRPSGVPIGEMVDANILRTIRSRADNAAIGSVVVTVKEDPPVDSRKPKRRISSAARSILAGIMATAAVIGIVVAASYMVVELDPLGILVVVTGIAIGVSLSVQMYEYLNRRE